MAITIEGILSIGQGIPGRNPIFKNNGTHIQWKYEDEDDTQWKELVEIETLRAAEVELQVTEEYIQWKYNDEVDWKNLISIQTLTPDISHLEKSINDKVEKAQNVIKEAEDTIEDAENRMQSIEERFEGLVDGTGTVDKTYLQNNYYNKVEIDDKLDNLPSIYVTNNNSTTDRNEHCMYIVTDNDLGEYTASNILIVSATEDISSRDDKYLYIVTD